MASLKKLKTKHQVRGQSNAISWQGGQWMWLKEMWAARIPDLGLLASPTNEQIELVAKAGFMF